MYIKELIVKNFRNYSFLELSFSPGINCIVGNNGVGKTNILEAISIVSNIRSFRNNHDAEIIKWNEEGYYCSSVVQREGEEEQRFEIGCSLRDDAVVRKLKIDGVEIKNVDGYYGKILSVILSPIDIQIVHGSPDIRRRFIDSVIAKIDARYFKTLSEFRTILASRNRILKNIKIRASHAKELDVWDILFSKKSVEIVAARGTFVTSFNEIFHDIYAQISNEAPPSLSYRASIKSDDPSDVQRMLEEHRSRDIAAGSSGIGPQRDDVVIQGDAGMRFTSYASQGQKRTAAVALKVSECMFLEQNKGERAIVLVDDIFSELDAQRRARIVDILRSGNQIIVTMVHCDDDALTQSSPSKVFYINAPGVVKEIIGLQRRN